MKLLILFFALIIPSQSQGASTASQLFLNLIETVLAVRSGEVDSGTIKVNSPTGAALTPSFASPSSTADGFIVQVSNHDSDYAWAVNTSAGSVSISGSGLITVTTSRIGYARGTANVSGTATSGVLL